MKQHLTLDDHRAFGETLKDAREQVLQWIPKLCAAYPVNGRAVRSAYRSLHALDHLKNEMDSLVFSENYGIEDLQAIYFGQSKQWHERQAKLK